MATLFSDQPHVVLAIFGEQGTGKTTALKVLVRLLDPSPVPVRKPPRDADSWVTAAAGSWVVGLDNLSDIPPWLSDSLCRASTGDGDVRRKLYSDSDYAVFSFRRCIMFDAIDVGALAPDLADRTVAITLELIADEDRLDEETFWSEWARRAPAAARRGARPRARESWRDSRRSGSPASRAWPTSPASSLPSTPNSAPQPSTGTPSRPRTSPPRACPVTRSRSASWRGHRTTFEGTSKQLPSWPTRRPRMEGAEGLASQRPGGHRPHAPARPGVPQDRVAGDGTRARSRQRDPLAHLSSATYGEGRRGRSRRLARLATGRRCERCERARAF